MEISESEVLAAIREYAQGGKFVWDPDPQRLPDILSDRVSPLSGQGTVRQVKARGHALDSAQSEKLRQMVVVRGMSVEEAAKRSGCSPTTWKKALSGESVAAKSWVKIGRLITAVPPAPGLSELTGLS